MTSKLVREAYSRIVEQGWSTGRLVGDWNKRKILTARDYQRHVNALERGDSVEVNAKVKGTKWSHRAMFTMLSKRHLIGQRVHKGEVIMGPDGLPQKFCEPILTQSEWDVLQEVLQTRGDKYRKKEKLGSGDLTGVVYCLCGRKQHELHSHKKATKTSPRIKNYYHYFWCSSRPASYLEVCDYVVCWPQQQVKDELESAFLHRLGNIEIKNKSFKPGVDNRPQIEEIKKGVARLTNRLLKFDDDDPRYIATEKLLEDHTATLRELEKEPVVPSQWVEQGTGVTFAQRWAEMDWEQRGWLLKGLGIRFIPAGTPKQPMYFLVHPDDVVEKAHHAAGGMVDALSKEVWLREVEEFQRIVAAMRLAA
ncbi:recombinase family protein [Streptomyces sp. NPDC051173]|uniref:recombinase family protein n=1 Tax=Streptomyces sp. NPDC051173 TaxID=3155164 RepID=UPI00344E44DB